MELLYFLLEKKILKLFVQCQVSALSSPGQGPSDEYPVITFSHGSRFL
jgi:hypothetical protein